MKIIKTIEKPEKSFYKVFVKGDYNDGDYISETNELTPSEFESSAEFFANILTEEFRKQYRANHQQGSNNPILNGLVKKYQTEFYFPSSDGYPIHSIHTIKITFHDLDGAIYNVTFENFEYNYSRDAQLERDEDDYFDEDDDYEEDENPECAKCEHRNNCRIDACPITE